MIRGSWVWDREKHTLVPRDEYYRTNRRVERSDFPCPMLSRGQLDNVWNPDDGKYYTTLRNYEKAIRKGKHIVEKGEWPADPAEHRARAITVDEKGIEQAISDSWDQLEAGHKAGPNNE